MAINLHEGSRPPPNRQGPARQTLVVCQFFLDAKLSFLEELEGRKIRHRPAQFIGKLAFEAFMLELQCADMRLFHTVLLVVSPQVICQTGSRIATGPDSGYRRVTAIVMEAY